MKHSWGSGLVRGIVFAASACSLLPGDVSASITWNVSCCTVIEVMTAFTVDRTGAYLRADMCVVSEDKCMDLKLIREFVEQSRTVLGRHTVDVLTESNLVSLTLHSNTDTASMVGLLAWAFIGRVVTGTDWRKTASTQKVFLEYDIHRNKLVVQRDSCEINKSLYRAMVLASVTLLVFFISMMVVDRVRLTGARPVALPGTTCAAANDNPLFSPISPGLRETRTSKPASQNTFEWDHQGWPDLHCCLHPKQTHGDECRTARSVCAGCVITGFQGSFQVMQYLRHLMSQ
jgi:hypothetical protein